MSRFRWSSLSFSQKALDLGMLCVAVMAASWWLSPGDSFWERGQWGGMVVGLIGGRLEREWLLLGVLIGAWVYCLSSYRLYGTRRLVRWRGELLETMKVLLPCTAALATASLVWRKEWVTTELLLLFWGLSTGLLFTFRLAKWRFLRGARMRGRNLRHVIIVGSGPRGQEMAEVLTDHPELGFNLLGFVDDQQRPGTIGRLEDMARILSENVVDEVLIALPIKSYYERIREIIRITEEQGIVVRIHSLLFDLRLAHARAEDLDRIPVLTHYIGPSFNWRRVCKGVIDLAGALALLMVCGPVMLMIALLVKLTSPGPALFVQERVGLGKRTFRIFKFRTMVADAESRQAALERLNEADGPVFKMRHDPRVTPLGGFLRRTSLDELPQLFNVLLGDLSLVGPRPLPLRDFERFDDYRFNRRFCVKPGITCIWQVSGRSETGFERWIEQDLEYIDRWSLLLDLKLLLLTVPAVLRGRGAM